LINCNKALYEVPIKGGMWVVRCGFIHNGKVRYCKDCEKAKTTPKGTER